MNRSVIEGGTQHHQQLQKTPRLSEFQPQGMAYEGYDYSNLASMVGRDRRVSDVSFNQNLIQNMDRSRLV